MPAHQQTITTSVLTTEQQLCIAYATFEQLGWKVLAASDNGIVAATPRNWKTWGQQVSCIAENNMLSVTSEMTNGELIDISNRNKKNVTAFITAFETNQQGDTHAVSEKYLPLLNELKQTTFKTTQEEIKQAVEVDQAMNLSTGNAYFTYAIIAVNIIIFALMVLNGAGLIVPNSVVHISWGSNYTPLTLSGDWWRLVSNIFIHFGAIHLLMNMYCLYTVGVYLEPMLGKLRYISGYFATGIIASLTSLWWHKEGVNSAGASGAVFGVYGLFLALLTTNLIPKAARQAMLQSIGIFIAYNLLYGMKSGVDNAAHIGGLVSGFITGYLFAFEIKKEKQGSANTGMALLTIAAAVLIGGYYLNQHKVSADDREKIISQVKAESYSDYEKFNEKLGDFDKINESISKLFSNTTLNEAESIKQTCDAARAKWKEATELLQSTNSYDISPASHQKATLLIEYIRLRNKELDIIEQKSGAELSSGINEIRTQANEVFEKALKQ